MSARSIRPFLLGSATLLFTACGDDGGGTTVPSTGGTPAATGDTGPEPDAGLLDQGAPPVAVTLAVTYPLEGAWLKTRRNVIQGTYTGTPSAITVNGAAAALDAGTFTATVDLQPGPQALTVAAGDVTLVVNVNVDPNPATVTIETPARGAWTADTTIPMRFTAADDNGLTGVFLNDRGLPGGGPLFTVDAPLGVGLNILTVRADDLAGNQAHESVSVLAGPTRDPDEVLDGAFRVHVGARGLAGLSAFAGDYVDGMDLQALLPAEPLEVAGFLIRFIEIRHAHETAVTLAPNGSRLDVGLHVARLEVDVELTSDDIPYPITLHAAAVDVTGQLSPSVVDGDIQLGAENLVLDLVDFGVDLTGVPSFAGGNGQEESFLEQLLEESAANLAGTLVPGLLDGLLGDFDRTFEIDVLEVPLTITLVPEELVVADDGLSLKAGAAVALVNPPEDMPDAPGFPGRRSGWDGVPAGDDLSIAIDDDVVNLLVFQLWRGGLALPVLDHAYMQAHPDTAASLSGVITSMLTTAYPNEDPTQPLRIATALTLPPVVGIVEAENGAGLTVGLGDLGLFIAKDNGTQDPLIDGAASLVAEGAAEIRPGEDGKPAVHLAISRMTTAFDVTTESLRGEVEAAIEAPVADIIKAMGGALPSMLGAIPLPAFDTLPIGEFRASVEENASDFLRVDAVIAAP